MRHRDDAAGDRGVAAVVRQVAYEGAVDLHAADREALQVGKRRVAGAEVVDCQAHPGVAQGPQQFHRALGVAHHHAFGDLQLETFFREAGLLENVGDALREALVEQLPHGQIHRHTQAYVPGLAQQLCLPAGFLQNPVTDLHHDPGLLRDRDEFARLHQALFRVAPAHQRLHACHCARGNPHLGLEVHRELLALQSPPQRRLDRQPLAGMHIHFRREVLESVLAGFLGPVHRHVAVLEQRLHVAAVVRIGADAYAGGDQELLVVDDQRPGRSLQDLERHRIHGLDAGGVLHHQYHKLVASEPGDDVAVAQACAQPCRHLLEQLVAGFVADGVVDVLEAVQVHQHQRAAQPVTLGCGERVLEGPVEVGAVGNAGEFVVVR